jgi:hypothetical protein
MKRTKWWLSGEIWWMKKAGKITGQGNEKKETLLKTR